MRIPEHVVKEIQDKARIEDVVGDYVSLTRKGDRFWGLSPFKSEKTPSFSVNPERNAYYCFSTQKGGGAVNFVMEMEHLTYPEALVFLARKYGIEISAEDDGLGQEYKKKKALIELYQRLVPTFSHLLLSSPQGAVALEYVRSRGISDESIRQFNLGYLPEGEWLWNFLGTKKYQPDFLAESGLFSRNHPRFSIFTGRLIFPISDISGSVVAFGGRVLPNIQGPKYINSPETIIYHKGSSVYGINHAKDAIKNENRAILCEGYMDVIALHQAGIACAVAPLGTAFTPDQAKLLKRMCNRVSLLFDNDQAGRTASEKAILTCEDAELDCDMIESAGEKDPADILLKDGSQALRKMVDCRINAFEYMADQFRRTENLSSPEGTGRFVRKIMPLVGVMKSPVRQEGSLRLLADMLGVGHGAIIKEFERFRQQPLSGERPVQQASALGASPRTEKETVLLDLRIMLAVSLSSGLFPFLRTSLRLEDLKDSQARELFISLEECFRDDCLEFSSLLAKIQDESLKNLLLRKQVEGEFAQNAETFVRGGVLRIRERNLVERRNSITIQLRKISHASEPDPRMERELLEETLIIDEAVKELRKQIDDRSAE